ncbi:MAG: MAPEG family protein [Proteobacteria bacterium]|nr:MAPEG family protein [Pseudomonadota bacterium]HQR03166.1 MAPEG family protein [Rhodocyclaceae bacterium]
MSLQEFHFPALVTLGISILQFGVMGNVGKQRMKHKIMPPATTGHPEFERAFRVQANTVEATLIFLPLMWLFACYLSPVGAGIVGSAWLVARIWYAVGYMREPDGRLRGFYLNLLILAVTALGSLWGIIRSFL